MNGDHKKKSFLIPFIIMVICAAIGTMVGKVAGILFFKEGGALHLLFSEGVPLSLETQKFSFGTWFIEFGFNIDINLIGLLFIIIFIVFYKKI
jgi:hypothetical protein